MLDEAVACAAIPCIGTPWLQSILRTRVLDKGIVVHVELKPAKLTSLASGGIGYTFAFAHSGRVQELGKNATCGTHALERLAQNAWEETPSGM